MQRIKFTPNEIIGFFVECEPLVSKELFGPVYSEICQPPLDHSKFQKKIQSANKFVRPYNKRPQNRNHDKEQKPKTHQSAQSRFSPEPTQKETQGPEESFPSIISPTQEEIQIQSKDEKDSHPNIEEQQPVDVKTFTPEPEDQNEPKTQIEFEFHPEPESQSVEFKPELDFQPQIEPQPVIESKPESEFHPEVELESKPELEFQPELEPQQELEFHPIIQEEEEEEEEEYFIEESDSEPIYEEEKHEKHQKSFESIVKEEEQKSITQPQPNQPEHVIKSSPPKPQYNMKASSIEEITRHEQRIQKQGTPKTVEVKEETSPSISWNSTSSKVHPISISKVLTNEANKKQPDTNNQKSPKSKNKKQNKVVMSFQELQRNMNKPGQWGQDITKSNNVSFAQMLASEEKTVPTKQTPASSPSKSKGKKNKPIVMSLQEFNASNRPPPPAPPQQQKPQPQIRSSFNALLEAEKHSSTFAPPTAPPKQGRKNHRRGKAVPFEMPKEEKPQQPAWSTPTKAAAPNKSTFSSLLESEESKRQTPKQQQQQQQQRKGKAKPKVIPYENIQSQQWNNATTKQNQKQSFDDLIRNEITKSNHKEEVQQQQQKQTNDNNKQQISYSKKKKQNKVSISDIIKQEEEIQKKRNISNPNIESKKIISSFDQLLEQEQQKNQTDELFNAEILKAQNASNNIKNNNKKKQKKLDKNLFWGAATRDEVPDFNYSKENINSPAKYLLKLIEEVNDEEGLDEFANSISKAKSMNEMVRNLSTIMTQQDAQIVAQRFFRRFPLQK
ncbi:fibrous sheath CABYR-binding protein [Histomonas meleagridis]|uniref:fibrous sheath CABYR-binding protein n=1 Tax=Histomonas meleagridis TaxID=135588 RepID=UPI00355A414F|nr:fibrous sheath CABYR-binding protein [Histomonas meleagridis]KAH0803745.1 fibrous sheath CABYR-binding protein [Histomonas meleagridis]